jgi:hypothetical protein
MGLWTQNYFGFTPSSFRIRSGSQIVHGTRNRYGYLLPAKESTLGRNVSAGTYSASATATVRAAAAGPTRPPGATPQQRLAAGGSDDDGDDPAERMPPGIKSASVNRPMMPAEVTRVTYDSGKYAGLLAPRREGDSSAAGPATDDSHDRLEAALSMRVTADGNIQAYARRSQRPAAAPPAASGKASKSEQEARAKTAGEATASRIMDVVEHSKRSQSSLGSRAL